MDIYAFKLTIQDGSYIENEINDVPSVDFLLVSEQT